MPERLDIHDERFWEPAFAAPFFAFEAKGGGLGRFTLNSYQQVQNAHLMRCYREGKNPLTLKSRRVGASTFYTFVLAQHTMFRGRVKTALLCNKGETTKELMRMVLTYWETCPRYIRPTRNMKVKGHLDLSGIKSELDARTVRSADPLRGAHRHVVVADEIGFWPEVFAHQAWTAAKNACAKKEDGGVLIGLSTPNFYGDPMCLEWIDATTNPDSTWLPSFVPWTAIPEYTKTPPARWQEHDKVQEYRKTHAITEEQACWMQRVGLPMCSDVHGPNSLATFIKEYPYDDIECWAVSGDPTFNRDSLQARLREIEAEHGNAIIEQGLVRFVDWKAKDPQNHRFRPFGIFCDPAGSFAARDMFGIEVLDYWACEQVAEYYGHDNAHAIAQLLIQLSQEHNNAEIYVEANGVGDSVLSHLLFTFNYPYVYHRRDSRKGERKPGWWSTQPRKVEAIGDLTMLLEDETGLLLHSNRLLRQLLQYRGAWDKLSRDAAGGHFDLVAALAIGAWAWRHSSFRQPVRDKAPSAPSGVLTRSRLEAILNGFAPSNTPYGAHR